MAFEDSILGGGEDFDPRIATESLIRAVTPGAPPTTDVRTLNTDLGRRIGQPAPPKPAREAPQPEPDFSGQAVEPMEANTEADFSAEAAQPPMIGPEVPKPPPMTVGMEAKAALKGIPHGAISHAGGIIQGAASVAKTMPLDPALLDELGRAKDMTPAERAKLMGRAIRSGAPTGMLRDYNSALQRIAQGGDAAKEIEALRPKIEANNEKAAVPVTERSLYKAGKAVKDFAQTVAPMTEQEKDSIGGRVGTGAGAIAPYALATLLGGPLVGMGAGAVGMATDTYGSVFEEAKKHGANDDVAASAASRSALVAGVLGTLPLGAGKYAKSLIAKVSASSAAFATAGEAQEAILQQIAKDYDPKAGYTFEQKRIIASLILGAGMGGLHHAFERGPATPPGAAPGPAPGPTPTGLPPGGGGPRPGPGPQPGPGPGPQPGGAGPHPGASTPPPGGGAGPQQGSGGPGQQQAPPGAGPHPSGPPPGSGTGKAGDPNYRMDPANRAKMERVYRQFEQGKDPSHLSDGELYDAVNEHLRDTSNTGYTAKPETAEEAAARESTAKKRDEDVELKGKFAWMTDAQINSMTPEMRDVWLARARGEKPGPKAEKPADATGNADAMRDAEQPHAAAAEPAPAEPGSKNDGQNAIRPTSESDAGATAEKPRGTGVRGDPVEIRTAEDVAAVTAPASGDYTHAQGEANNRQLGHGIWNGRSVRMEVAKGGVRKMVNPETGEPVEVTHAGAAYGYFPGTIGADKMAVDLIMGDHPESPDVFVIDEKDRATGKFRQHKVVGGTLSEADAFKAYVQISSKGPETVGGITKMSVPELHEWLDGGDTTKALKPPTSEPVKADAGGPTSTEAPLTSGSVPKETPTEPGAVAGGSGPATRPRPTGSDTPLSLLQFIASKGGLAPHPELDALDIGDHRVQIPGRKGFFGVIRPTGDHLDMIREAAEEAGYLRGEHNKTSTVRDLLDAIDEERNRGNRVMPQGYEGTQTKREAKAASERERHEQERHEIEYGYATRELIEAGYVELHTDLHDAAVRLMVDENLTPDDAVERAALRLVAEDADYGVTEDAIKDTFGTGAYDEVRAGPASEDGGRSPRQREERARPDQGEEDRGDGADVPRAGAQGHEAEKSDGEARAEVEAALGPDADQVAQVDISRATELMVDNPGMDPATAFGHAVIETAVEQGFITEKQAEDAYGPEVKDVLEAGREGTPVRGGDLEQERAESDEGGTRDTAEAGELSGRGKAGRRKGRSTTAAEAAAGDDAAASRATEQSAAGDEGADDRTAAEDADNARRLKPGTAPEHTHNKGKPLDRDAVYPRVETGASKIPAPIDEGIVPLTMSKEQFKEITDEWAVLFENPAKRTNLETKFKNGPFIPLDEAQKHVDEWKARARAQGNGPEMQANSEKTVLSLFDLTGEWAKPWAEAGYNVLTFDIQNGQDVMDFSVEYFNENYDFGEVYAILAATPCTDFAVSGAKHFAAKDADGRTEASKELVFQTLRTIEYFKPSVWVVENPVGRIESLTGLPNWRLLFNPNNFGHPYTKKTVLWGNFDADLPTANVEPTEGSKMWSQYGGKSQATKNARSETPEGFAYAFFAANNAADIPVEKRLTQQYPEASGAVKAALDAGVTEARIVELMDDTYGNYEYEDARNALIREATGQPQKPKVQAGDDDDRNSAWAIQQREKTGKPVTDGVERALDLADKFDDLGREAYADGIRSVVALGHDIDANALKHYGDNLKKARAEAVKIADEQDAATAKVQAADADEVVEVSLSREGPWDFNDTFPAPDPEKVAALEKEGRNPFENPNDAAEVSAAVDDGVYDMIEEMATIRGKDEQIAALRAGKVKLKKNEKAADRIAALTKERNGAAETLRGHMGTFEDVFGRDAARAMMKEARRRIVTEEGQHDKGVDRTAPEPAPAAPTVEKGADNKPQMVLPGAEKASDATMAQRAADQPLKPKVAQKPADTGLFGDEMNQRDLLDDVFVEAPKKVEPAVDKFPAYTTNQLRDTLDDGARVRGMSPETVAAMRAELEARNKAERDAPTWAEILHALPKLTEGRFAGKADLDAAANLMFEITGQRQPSYGDLTPAQKHEMMARLKGEPAAAPPAKDAFDDIFDDAVNEQFAKPKKPRSTAPFSRENMTTPKPSGTTSLDDVTKGLQGIFGKKPGLSEDGELPAPKDMSDGAIKDELSKGFTGPSRARALQDERLQRRIRGEWDESPGLSESEPTFVEDTYRQALPYFKAGVAHFPDADLTTMVRALVKHLAGAGMDADAIRAMKPYIKRFVEDYGDGVQAPVHAGDAPAGPENVQPDEPGRNADGVRGREGSGSEPAVPRIDGERAEGGRRVSEGAGGERGDRASDGGDARLPEARADDAADGRAKRPAKRAADTVGENFTIEPGALDEGRGQMQKARDNIKAIAAMQLIEMEGRPATAAEQADLARYVGWGGIKNIFPDDQGAYGTGFTELGPKLKGLLSEEEYATARRSIQYAHYTAEDVVRSMWDAVAKLGFTGGQVFEPGMGIGNFAGMMPQDIAANTHYQGVELDHVTARIAKLLYPKYGVRQDDFTKTRLPENSYDLVIGNPPFADVAIKSDPKYKQGFLLHDYFFAKSLDAVRPGGLLAFVTSAGTMNKLDPAAREYLADRADLVGAIRLPGDAFKKNAGTEVTTDIIFLRKRLPGDVAGDRSWTETDPVDLPGKDGDIKVNVNSYFLANPRMVLGRQDANDKLYPGRYSVKSLPGSDLKADLAAAIEGLPADVMTPWQDTNADQHQHDFDTTEKKEGTYYVGPDGSLHQVTNGVGQKVGQRGKGVENGRTAADMERIKGLVPVRDALRAVYAADLKGDTANATRARETLNKSYDAFVEKFGPINKAVIQTRRPNVIQMEAARAEAREEARYADATFREGDFDATALLDAKTPLSIIARKRQEARDEASKKGLTFDEGDFDLDEVPDVIIDKRPNVDPFMDDPESYRLRAIEQYDEGTGKGHKSDVFFKNVITREVTPKINSVNDGLLYSLSQYGRVNIPAIAELVKKSEAEVIDELGEQVFKVPGTKDAFQTRDEYLSGNVRKKLDLAQRAADRNPEFRRNVAALEANQPAPLAPSQIHAGLGMPWIPPATIQQFAREELGLDNTKVRYTKALASWTVSGDVDSVAARSTWGTEDRRAPALLQDALNRQTTKIYDTVHVDGKKSQVLNVAKTEAANDKLMQIKEKFAGWIWTDQERADTLAAYYNENYNNLVVREYNGDYLTTPGIASDWSWRPHQKRVIARIIQSGNTYVAHAVGAGKTSEYIGAIMEMRRLGLVRKPMVAVPNHMLAQFTKEWYHQYPTARLAIADDKRFHTDRRKQFIANVAMEDLDAIIITHSSFGMIPVSDEFQNGVVNREISQYREVLADLKNQGGDTRITRSRIEKQIERLEQRLVSRKGRKDATFTFEEMGVDHLTIDEAHLFRKLDFSTAMSNLKGVSPEGSQMAWDLYVKSLYLDTVRPGRGLVLGSGTPITNTMAELYTLSRYLQPQVLADRGLEKFDAWAGAFGDSVSELEQNAAGEYKPVSRFAKFVNVPELSAMVRQIMDVVTGKQLEQYVPRPQLKGGKRQFHLAEKSREQARFIASLAERMKAIAERKGPPQKGDDILLSVINDGRHASIDMRLAGGDKESTPSKLDLMVNNAYEIWAASKRQPFHKIGKDGKYEAKPALTGPATQLLFVNLGLSGARGFSVPDYIRAELVRRGVPKDEIAYIYDYKSATAKQRLFNDMNEGKKRILIGSVAKMGVGTNVQKRLLATHNMDPLWYPADDEQRVGRIIRQGNMNPEVQVHDYSTKGTYDSTMWGMMAKKARFIQSFFEGDLSLRDMEDLGEASQYEQAKALTTSDPRLIRFTELKQELERANRRKSAFDSDVYNTRVNRQRAKAQIEHYTQRIDDTKKDIEQRVDTRGDAFSGKVGKDTFDKRADFGVALFERLAALEDTGSLKGGVKVATVGGFDIYATVRKSNLIKDHTNVDVFMSLNGNATREVSYETSSLGTVRSIEHILHGFESDLVEYEHRLAKAAKFFKDSEATANAKFEGDADIAALAKQVADMAAELAKPIETAPAVPAETKRPQGQRGQEEVLRKGRKDGKEHLIAYAADGHAVTRSGGDLTNFVSFSPEFIKVLMDPTNDIVAHHNHPNGSPLSVTDIMTLAYPGMSAIWAHGNNGNIYRAELTPEAKHEFTRYGQTPPEVSRRLEMFYNQTRWRLHDSLQQVVTARAVEPKEASDGLYHLVNEILAEAGIIDYRSNYDIGDLVLRTPGLNDAIRSAVDAARKDAFGDKANNDRADRRAGPLRHPGDLGASFDRGEVAAPVGSEGLGHADSDESDFIEGEGPGLAQPNNTFKKPGSEDTSLGDVLRTRLLGRLGDLNATEARVQLQDKFARIKNAEEAAGAPSSLSAYQAESLYYGRTGQRLESLNEHHIDPIIREMKARDIDLDKIDEFLSASHAPERNNKIGQMYPPGHQFHDAMTDHNIVGGSGWSTNEALGVIRAARAAGKLGDYRAVAQMVWTLNYNTRRKLYDSGLIDRDTFDAWNNAYRYYTPQRGTTEGDQWMGAPSGVNVRGKEAKTAFGRRSKADSPLAYSIMQAEMAIVRSEKNKVGNTFLQFVRANPDPARWTINRPPLVKRIDPSTGLVTSMTDNLYANRDDVFTTKINGRDVHIQLHGPDGLNLARALKNMGSANVHPLIRAYSTLTHTMAKLATSANPDFMIPNFARDLGEAFINLSEQQQRGFVRAFVKHLPGAMKGSMVALAGGGGHLPPGSPPRRYIDAFHEFDKAGGRIRFFGIDDPDQIETNVGRKLRRLQGGPINTLKDIGDKAAKALEIAGGGIENATRLAAYMAARDAGFSIPDAAMLARNLTVDFNKKGELGGAISALYMFANAGIQGQARMARALGHRRVWMAVGALAAASALATLFSILAGGEDEAGLSNYMKVPPWERDKNLIFMLPGGTYIKVPLPYGFAPFAVVGSRAVATLMGHEKPGKAAGAVIESIINAFNPLGEESNPMMDVVPSAVRPGFHIAFNKNWTGKPLYPQEDATRGQRPDSTQSFNADSAFSKKAAKLLNEWSGGNTYKPGGIDVHPGSLDHALQAIGGGAGRFLKGVADTIATGIKGEEWQPEKTPILRRFVGKIGAQHDAAAFYEQRKEVRDAAANTAAARKDAKTGVNVDEAREAIDGAGGSQAAIFRGADAQMKPRRAELAKIEANSSLTDEQRERAKTLKQEMRDIQNAARRRYKESKEQGAMQ